MDSASITNQMSNLKIFLESLVMSCPQQEESSDGISYSLFKEKTSQLIHPDQKKLMKSVQKKLKSVFHNISETKNDDLSLHSGLLAIWKCFKQANVDKQENFIQELKNLLQIKEKMLGDFEQIEKINTTCNELLKNLFNQEKFNLYLNIRTELFAGNLTQEIDNRIAYLKEDIKFIKCFLENPNELDEVDLALAIVKRNGNYLEELSDDLKNNSEVVKAASTTSLESFQYASEELKNNPAIIQIFLDNYGFEFIIDILPYEKMGTELKKNPALVSRYLETKVDSLDIFHFEDIDENLRNNTDFQLGLIHFSSSTMLGLYKLAQETKNLDIANALLEKNPTYYTYFNPHVLTPKFVSKNILPRFELSEDKREIVLSFISQPDHSGADLKDIINLLTKLPTLKRNEMDTYLTPNLRNHPDVMRYLVKYYPLYIQHASDKLKKSLDFLKLALDVEHNYHSNYMILKYLPTFNVDDEWTCFLFVHTKNFFKPWNEFKNQIKNNEPLRQAIIQLAKIPLITQDNYVQVTTEIIKNHPTLFKYVICPDDAGVDNQNFDKYGKVITLLKEKMTPEDYEEHIQQYSNQNYLGYSFRPIKSARKK